MNIADILTPAVFPLPNAPIKRHYIDPEDNQIMSRADELLNAIIEAGGATNRAHLLAHTGWSEMALSNAVARARKLKMITVARKGKHFTYSVSYNTGKFVHKKNCLDAQNEYEELLAQARIKKSGDELYKSPPNPIAAYKLANGNTLVLEPQKLPYEITHDVAAAILALGA